jgi:Uma2 family endonuclease
MNNGMQPSAATADRGEVIYPDGDGKPMAETGIHVLVMFALIGTLRHYFAHRRDVYVIGNIFLYYEEGRPGSRRSPDVMVVKGVEPGERRSFKTWVERAVPSVIIEVTSQETADEDLGPKRELYERLGVREYFLFDPLHEYLERSLQGYRLIGDAYEPLPPADDGGLLSAELGLRLVPEGPELALFRFRTGERVPAPPDAYRLLDSARQQAAQAEQQLEEERRRAGEIQERANLAEQQLEEERRRSGEIQERASLAEQQRSQAEQQLQQERRRAQQLAEELARLRAQLPPSED